MKSLNFLTLLSLIFVLLITSSCGDDGDNGDDHICKRCTPPPSEYPKTVKLEIKSDYAFDNYTYPITIFFPKAFEKNKNLPVIYVLDGKLNMAKAKTSLPSGEEAIFVGIGDLAFKEAWQRRWTDLMPEESQCFLRNGRHQDFYNFIANQVIQIEDTYGITPESRTLMGHSSAGLFATVALFMQDSDSVIFQNYIASDPELGCDLGYFIKMLHDYDFPEGTIKLYLALSNDGNIEEVREFSEILESKEYSWLNFKYEEFLDQDHMGVLDPSFRAGLRFLFE